MRLSRKITSKLEDTGYIIKEKRGRKNLYKISDSVKYVARVSGLFEAFPRNPFN